MVKVLVLCHANRWRSPLAAAFLARHVAAVKSAGFMRSGLGAGKPVREAAARYGLDLSDHRSTQVSEQLLQWADLVFLMNKVHLTKLKLRFSHMSNLASKCKLLGDFASPKVDSIPDLAFINQRSPDFERVVSMIKQAVECYAATLTR